MEGDETGSEQDVNDEGRKKEELFKQMKFGEFPQCLSLFSSSSVLCSHLPVLLHQNTTFNHSSCVQMFLSSLCVALVLTKC